MRTLGKSVNPTAMQIPSLGFSRNTTTKEKKDMHAEV